MTTDTTDGVNLTGFWRRSTSRSTCGPWSGTSSAYATSSARPSSNRVFLMHCKGTRFEQFVHQAMTEVRMMLPQSIEVNLERALDTVSFHAEPLRGEEVEVAGRYQLLTQAIEDRRTIETEYYTARWRSISLAAWPSSGASRAR